MKNILKIEKKSLNPFNITMLFFMLLLMSTSELDSAVQWKRLTNIPAPFDKGSWLDIYFLKDKPDYGWVCGWLGNILRTTDGGKSWNGTNIRTDSNSNLQLECIRFANEKVGYTSGSGKIFKSVDGGGSWFDVTDPRARELWGNYFSSPDTGIVVGGGCDSPQQFFRTTNGGISWYLYTDNVMNSGLTHVILYSVDGPGFATSSGLLWVTQNGGITWQIMSVSGHEDWQEMIAISGNSIMLPYSPPCTGGDPGGVRFSKNFGQSWKQFSTGAAMFGAFLIDSLKGWTAGWKRSLYYTSDGGDNWELENCGIEPTSTLDDIWFTDDTTGFAVGTGIWKISPIDTTRPEILALTDTIVCEGANVLLSSKYVYDRYLWSTGDTTKQLSVLMPGVYSLQAWKGPCDYSYIAKINVLHHPKPQPVIQAVGSPTICEGDSVILLCQKEFVSFHWSTGDTTNSITVSKSGKYFVDIVDTNGCIARAEISVRVIPNPQPRILSRGEIKCVGDSLSLYTDKEYADYKWYILPDSNPVLIGKREIVVRRSGLYVVRVFTPEGCTGISDTIDVSFKQDTNAISILTKLSDGILKFDSVLYTNVLCKTLTLSNVGWRDVSLKNIRIALNIAYSMPQSQFPFSLKPGESKDITICFSPTKLGLQTDTLIMEDNCWPHKIILKGYGQGNTYFGNTLCDATLIFKTKSVPKKYTVSVGRPFPNPSFNTINVPFELESDKPVITNVKIEFYNNLGQSFKTGCSTNSITNQINNNNIESGDYQIDVTGFTKGMYVLKLSVDENSFFFPIIISN